MEAVRILDSRFDALDFAATVEAAFDLIRSGERGYVCTVNCAILMMMRSDPRLREFVENAAIVVADGIPIVWASKLLGRPLPARVAGVELVDALVARAAAEGLGVYLLGARPDVIEHVVRTYRQRHPDLDLRGHADGYFAEDRFAERAKEVAASGARLLIVGMGVPRQERFLEQCWEELGVDLAIGVGGSFDVIAGLRKRAPRFLQSIGMEWSYRLLQEPRRLWKRYLVTNTQFVYHVARELLTRGRRGRVRRGAE